MSDLQLDFIQECQQSLFECKKELLEQLQSFQSFLQDREKGDEAEHAQSLQNQEILISKGHSIRKKLIQIEQALSRIEDGTYGICVETEEPIEVSRLRAIPWTELSIAGAEYRERENQRVMGERNWL